MKSHRFYPILAAFVVMSLGVRAQTIYLYYETVTQGNGPAGHVNEVPVLAFSGGLSRAPAALQPSFLDYTITKEYDGASERFLIDAANGTVRSKGGAELRFYSNQGGIETLVMKIELKDTRITSYEVAGIPCESCSQMTENISISFGKIKIGTFEWDLDANAPGF